MTDIRLYHGVSSIERFLAKLLVQKLLPDSKKVVVVTSDAQAAGALNDHLWTVSETSFIPHCLVSSKEARDTPVVIAHLGTVDKAPVRDVMVALDGALPEEYASYENLIAIIKGSIEENDFLDSRLREMEERGFKCKIFNMSDRKAS